MGLFDFGAATKPKLIDGSHISKYSEQVKDWQSSLARLKQRRDAEEKEADRLRQLTAKLKAQLSKADTNYSSTMSSLGSLKKDVNRFQSTFIDSSSANHNHNNNHGHH